MTLNNVIHLCGDKDINLEIYEGRYSEETVINLDSARMEEIAFQKVLQIIPLRGIESHPSPALAIVIENGDPEIPEDLMPKAEPLKEFLQALPPHMHRIINGRHTEAGMVASYYIEGDYPEIPVIRFEVADVIVSLLSGPYEKND